MRVRDVMTAAAQTDAPDDTVGEAAAKMWAQQTGSLLVMEEDNLVGIITERDLLRVVAQGKDPKSVTVRDAMSENVVTIPPDTRLQDAAELMFQKWFRHLPVVDEDGSVVGIISLRDLLTMVAQSKEEPETLEALTGHRLVRDVRLERIEAGDLD